MPKPALVLVLGMPHSGGSLVCALLARLGLDIAGAGTAAEHANNSGEAEWDALVAIQDRLLFALRRWGLSSEGSLAMPAGWLEHPATAIARAELRELLLAEVAQHRAPWAIRDPRCSRLLPLWIELSRELEIPLHLLLAVRDPAEVTAALLRHQGLLTGMDIDRAQQLWWRHNLEVVHAARSAALPLTVLDCAGWFDHPRDQLERLLAAVPLPDPSAALRDQALALIQPGLHHTCGSAIRRDLDPAVCRLHQRLLRHPLPRRMPDPEPPARLQRALSQADDAAGLQSRPELWAEWLEEHRHVTGLVCSHLPDPLPVPAHAFEVELCGANWMELQPHLLMQRVALAGLEQLQLDHEHCAPHRLVFHSPSGPADALHRVVINLELPPLPRRAQWLGHLRAQPLVLDPDPARVLLLQALGVRVQLLDQQAPVNGWLEQAAASSADAWAWQLGLAAPAPDAVIVLGSAGVSFDRDLALEARQGSHLQPVIHYVPCWSELVAADAPAGLAHAGWLQCAARLGGRLVHAADQELPALWASLDGLRAPPWCLPPSCGPSDLRALHISTPLRTLAEDRPTPSSAELFHWSNGQEPAAAVVVSLFNYGACITAALESVAAQSCPQLELIVVDDASVDGGADVVRVWMQEQLDASQHRFARLLLLRHRCNAGLATARNSAFEAARAPWCFVLDADNALYPEAVSACLELAHGGSEQLGVVHPLLAVEAEEGRADDTRSLASVISWQRNHFLDGNKVDAMALVRRAAWQAAGGYTHIEGGWEDFDFWCKLHDAGFHGLQCPRILAVYRSHVQSMSHTATNSNWRALSRTLQDRHPWLQLPLAAP